MRPQNEIFPALAMAVTKLMIKKKKTGFNTFHISDEARSDLTLLIFKHSRSPEVELKAEIISNTLKIMEGERRENRTKTSRSNGLSV